MLIQTMVFKIFYFKINVYSSKFKNFQFVLRIIEKYNPITCLLTVTVITFKSIKIILIFPPYIATADKALK